MRKNMFFEFARMCYRKTRLNTIRAGDVTIKKLKSIDIEKEMELIRQKKSMLPSQDRKLVQWAYDNKIKNEK